MPTSKKSSFGYFESLSLQNVKAFAGEQTLNLTGNDGYPSRWTLILGDNGLGKTTLLRCLAHMRPFVNVGEPGEPDVVEPMLWQEDNSTLERLVRVGPDVDVRLALTVATGHSFVGKSTRNRSISLELNIERKKGAIAAVQPSEEEARGFAEPLVIGYGAGRHMGTANVENADLDPIRSLFSVASELFDAEDILTRMDHAALREFREKRNKSGHANRQLQKLKQVVATLLPQIDKPENIVILGPRLPGSRQDQAGIYLKTPYGDISLSDISLGYQTMTAWAVDLAWRLFAHYPDSPDPLSEPAIVLIDEIDLHLHPKWQRKVRRDLTEHFPNVQFIVTAHSPFMAQSSLDANLAVLKQEEDHVVIVNDPEVIADWRLDQIVTSELFGLETARPPELERVFNERINLIRKSKRTARDNRRLKELDELIAGLSTAETVDDQRAMDVIREAASLIRQKSGK